MKTLFLAFSLAVLSPLSVMAAGGGHAFPADSMSPDHGNQRSLQRGAATFVNYCMGCHGASYMRYNRVAQDLGIPEHLALENLVFTQNAKGEPTKVGELMISSMTPSYGDAAFGVAPPDLSVITRSRGSEWLYNYMRGFYVDESRPMGVNNGVFKDVGMPHVLWELEGRKAAEFDDAGNVVGFTPLTEGSLSTREYDEFAYDLSNFLDYVGEPYKAQRQRVGVIILLFLAVFGAVTYALKREYWRDVR